jgi:hypothetical protein
MAVETNAMAGAVRQSRYFVVRAKTGVSDYFASRGINRFTWRTDARRSKAGVLRFPLQVPYLALPLGRLAEHECAGDVRLISINTAATVHQYHVALFQFLRSAAAVRKSCVLSKTAKDAATYSQSPECSAAVARELALRHAFTHVVVGSPVSNDGDVIRALHQSEFSLGLKHATASRNRIGTDILKSRSYLADTIEEKKTDSLFHSNATGSQATVAENFSHSAVGTLVFFPGANVLADFD